MVGIPSSNEKAVYSFIREKDNDKVFAVFNLSAKPVDVKFNSELIKGNYLDVFANKSTTLTSSENLKLKPWGFKFFVKK